MSEPLSPQNKPYASEVEEGKTYYWCACGQSKNQPYCDGSHQRNKIIMKLIALHFALKLTR